MEDGIPGWLHHCHKAYYEKDGYYGRQTLIVDKECTTEMYFLDEQTWYIIKILVYILGILFRVVIWNRTVN